MITAAKKIRARAGSLLMFATLDDLEGSVELMVFEKTLAAAEAALQLDEIVLVKGRVDHKEGGKTCVIVQEVERFDPSDAEIEKARAQAVKAAEPPKPLCLTCSTAAPAGVGDRRPQADHSRTSRASRSSSLEVHDERSARARCKLGPRATAWRRATRR